MMKRIRLPLLAFAVATLVGACDVIDAPYRETPVNPGGGDSIKQNILLEDYTGHTCGNCPEAATIAKQLETTYGADRVIIVAVHAGPFAYTELPDYPTDFQTPEGTQLDNTFRISRAGNPNGMVNRTARNGKVILGKDQWATVVSGLIASKPAVDLDVSHTYNAATRTVDITAKVKYLSAGTSDYQIVALLTESKIFADQKDYRRNPSHVPDYEFEHVMRSSMNGTWGEALSAQPVAAGQTVDKTISYTIPADKTWKPENCSIVVYVHRHNTTKEVLQVKQAKLIK